MRYLLSCFCILTLCCVLLFLYRLQLTEKIIENRLRAVGGTNVQVTVTGLTHHLLSVESLQSTFTKDSPLQRFLVRNLSLQFDLREIMKGNVTELVIDSLQLTLNEQKKEKDVNGSPIQDIRPFLPLTSRENIRAP